MIRCTTKLWGRHFSKSGGQSLPPDSQERRVPSSRIERLINFGGLAAGLGVGAVSEVIKKNIEGVDGANDLRSAVLSEANIERIVSSLCRVRGAALKMAQFLSIQDSNFVDPAIRRIFDRVRQGADYMPPSQLKKVLERELGSRWRENFSEFEGRPFAAASLGQVHRGRLSCGRSVAVKVQYIGVDRSIESDVRNLLAIVRMTRLFPRGMFAERAAEVARGELMREVDYGLEADSMRRFRKLLEGDDFMSVPAVVDHLSTRRILTADLVEGQPVNTLVGRVGQDVINEVCANIFHLVLRELYDWRVVQSDPNWSNFYYDVSAHRLHLLDFGATVGYSKQFVDKYLRLIDSAIRGDTEQIRLFSREVGFLTGEEGDIMVEAHCASIRTLGEALGSDSFDFGRQDVTERISRFVPLMMRHRLTAPPEETYSIHRKLAGIFMLFCELKAVVPCCPIFNKVVANYVFD